MKKFIILLMALMIPAMGQIQNCRFLNYNINSFKADSLKYTDAFNVTNFENVSVQIRFNDTSNASFDGDSVKCYYFWQRGKPAYKSTGTLDTAWDQKIIILDTIDAITDANWKVLAGTVIGTDGTYPDSAKALDSVTVTGYGVSERQFSPQWSPFARIGIKGLTGNDISSFLALKVDVFQREATRTDSRTGNWGQ